MYIRYDARFEASPESVIFNFFFQLTGIRRIHEALNRLTELIPGSGAPVQISQFIYFVCVI